MTNIETYAIDELTRIGMYGSGDEMNDAQCQHILRMVNVFANVFTEEGHSGFSAEYVISILQKLLRFEPLSPLTGEDDEWNEVGEECGNSTNFFRPRDVGCNRYSIFDENGNFLRDELRSGFEFTDFADLKQKLVKLLGQKLYDHLYITECGRVINGLCIGYVDEIKND